MSTAVSAGIFRLILIVVLAAVLAGIVKVVAAVLRSVVFHVSIIVVHCHTSWLIFITKSVWLKFSKVYAQKKKECAAAHSFKILKLFRTGHLPVRLCRTGSIGDLS